MTETISKPLLASEAVLHRPYKTVHGIIVTCLGRSETSDVFLTLSGVEDSPVINVPFNYLLYELLPEELPILKADASRLDTRIGYTLHRLTEVGPAGIHVDTLISELRQRGLATVGDDEQAGRDLYLSIRTLKSRGHNIARIADIYYYKGLLE